MEYSYDIFLSYRHKPLDTTITQKTFHLLESYKLPAHIRKRGADSISRVFRDTEELAVSRILSNTIEEALRGTNCLVVVCSPDTPSSEWVDREVATFIELGRAEKIFPLLIAGTPETSFPPSLRLIPDIAERVMDVRTAGDVPKKIIANEEHALLRVIAAVCRCSPTDLLRRHKLRKARQSITKWVGAAMLSALVLVGSATLWAAAENYREAAQREQTASMTMLQDLTYELPDNLAEVSGTYGKLTQILQENAAQINRILGLSEQDTGIREEIAANYEKLATALVRIGGFNEALESEMKAIELYEKLYKEGSADAPSLLASSWNNAGAALKSLSDYTGATDAFERAISYQTELLAEDDSFAARRDLAIFYSNAGANDMSAGGFRDAVVKLEKSYDALLVLCEKPEADVQTETELVKAALNLGNCKTALGEYAPAQAFLQNGVATAEAIFAQIPNRTNLLLLSQISESLASCLIQQAKFDEALLYFDSAIAGLELLAQDLENTEVQTALGILYNNYGLCYNMSGEYAAAEAWYIKNANQQELLHWMQNTPLSQATLARAYYNVAENAYKSGAYDLSRDYFTLCLELYEPVSAQLGDYHHAEYLARLAYYQIIHERDYALALVNAAAAADLQPDSSFVLCNFGYALMFNDYTDACDMVFLSLAERSVGEVVNVTLDFEAMTAAGLTHEHMAAVITMMQGAQELLA